MVHLVRTERMNMNLRRNLMDSVNQIYISLKIKRRVNPGKETDFGDIALCRKPNAGLYPLGIKTVGFRIARFLPKPAEPAEVLADIGHMQVLVPDKGDDIADFPLPHFIGSSSNTENIAAGRLHEECALSRR